MAIQQAYNPALAQAGAPTTQQAIKPTKLDQDLMDLISDKDQGAALATVATQPPGGQQQQQPGGLFGQLNTMDWRARAAILMRQKYTSESNQQGQPAWMLQRG